MKKVIVWTGDVAQRVECQPSTTKTLDSTLSTAYTGYDSHAYNLQTLEQQGSRKIGDDANLATQVYQRPCFKKRNKNHKRRKDERKKRKGLGILPSPTFP